jgi:hypothetical protein
MHMIYVVLYSFSIFCTLPHKRYDLLKKGIISKMCVLLYCTILSEIFLILRRIQQDIILNVYLSPCIVPVIPVRF